MTYNLYEIIKPHLEGAQATVKHIGIVNTPYQCAIGTIIKHDEKYYLVAMVEVDGQQTNLICNVALKLNIDLSTKFSQLVATQTRPGASPQA